VAISPTSRTSPISPTSRTSPTSPRRLFGDREPRTRKDFQQVLLQLCAPFAETEDFARPLAIRRETIAGTDPEDPGFWGFPESLDQRIAESAALALALALAPDEIWKPLTVPQRTRFAEWLRIAARAQAHENNWRLFATLVNAGLTAVGEEIYAEVTLAAFARVDEFYQGGGRYSDGEGAAFDHYGPWAIHFYRAAPLRPLPDDVIDLERFRVKRRDRAGGLLHYYRHVAEDIGTLIRR